MILWLDTETTGYNPLKHGIVEIAALFEIPGEVKEWVQKCNPQDVEYTDDATAVNRVNKAMAMEYPKTAREAVTELFMLLRGVTAAHEKKFVIGGYNVQFDVKFFGGLVAELGGAMDEISQPFSDEKKYLDVYPMAKAAMKDQKATENHKLRTMLDYFEVPYNPEELHTAIGDIRATKALYEVIQGLNGEKK